MKSPFYQIKCLAPLVDENTRILILGTMPGEESLLRQMYYANPRNHFWDFMYRLLVPDYPPYKVVSSNVSKDERYALLLKSSIGLWDTIASCYRSGSSDRWISDKIYNDIYAFTQQYPIQHIICNSEAAYKNLVNAGNIPKLSNITIDKLPSSSSQNPLNTFAVYNIWQQVLSPLLKHK